MQHVKDGFYSGIPLNWFRTPATGFRIIWKWNLDSGFQSLMGFGIPWPVFRIPQPKISLIPESGFPYTVHGARFTKQNVSEIYSTLYLPLFPFLSLLLVCTWLHGGHVGGEEQKHFSPPGTKLHFHVNSSRKNYVVLTTNIAALSLACKPRIPSLFT